MAPSTIFSTPSRSRMNNVEHPATANGSAMAPAGPDGTSGGKEYTISVPGTVASKMTAVAAGAHGALAGLNAGPIPSAPRTGLDKDPVSPATPAAAITPPLPSSAIAANGAGKTAFEGAAAFSVPGTPTQDSRQEIRMDAVSPKPSSKVVLQEALKSLTETGRETFQSTLETVKTLRAKKPINVTLDQLVQGLFFTVLGVQLLLIKIFRPSPWHLMVFTTIGFAFGLGCSFMYFANKRRKAEACEVLGMNVGLKGLQHLVGTLPSWLSYTEHEKVAWLNKTLLEVWPFYDKGVCKMVKKQTETIFAQALKTMKVPGIKSIGFKQLTFGDAPFRVETIHVNDKQHDAMVMELDVRWCGEANITLAIELIAGEFAKMCPRVTDITFVGSLRIVLKPLVDEIPGFGAALVTFRTPPRLKYRLDFGNALGGKYAATVVKPFINHVINNIIVNMLVWPQRLVVPVINSEAMQVEIQKMAYRNQGMLKVTLVQATGLRKADIVGSSDPMVEVTTDGKKTVSTKTMRNTLTPRWDETFWLLVQEPTAQEMKVTVNDKDFFSAGNLLSTNPTSAFGAKELLGRCSVKLAPITAQEPEPVTKWYHLGEGDWTNSEGCGKGCGRIQITALYRGFDSFKADELSTAELGVLMIRVQHASKLPRSAGSRGAMTAYVRVKCGEQAEETPPVTSKGDHKFTNRNVFDFYDVKYSADVKIKVFEATMGADDEIGDVEIGVSDIAGAKDVNPLSGKQENGLLLRTFNLENSGGASIVVELRYAPYF